MKEKNSYSSQKLSKYLNPKMKLSGTESFASINSNNFSTNEKEDISTLMSNIIQRIIDYQTQNDGKTKDEEISFQIKNCLYDINKKIENIIDDRKNTFLHILAENSKLYPLKIICDTYYFNLNDENLFFKWFFYENKDSMTVLDIASIKGNKQILSYLYTVISKTNKSRLGFDDIKNKQNTFFHYSAKHNQYYSILFWYEKLQKYFPDIKIFDTRNKHNLTPLHYACFHNCYKCVQLLLDLGSDINAVDENRKSILIYAVNSNNIKIIELLLLSGADYNKVDSEGKTAYDYSVDVCSKNIQLLLKKKNKMKLIINSKNSFEIIILLLMFLSFILLFLSRFIDVDNFENLIKYKFIFFGLLFLGISLILVFISLLFISYFLCCIKHRQHLRKKKPNLLDLYDKYNTDICIKCLRRKKENTYHCNICNLCIDEWKFHSFWLDTCITKDKIIIYIIFILSIILLLLSNVSSEIFFLLFSFYDNVEYKNINNLFNNFFYFYYDNIQTNNDINDIENNNKKFKNYYFIPFLLVLICFYLFITIKIILNFCNRNKKTENLFIKNHSYNSLQFGLIDDDEGDNRNDTISSHGASIGD